MTGKNPFPALSREVAYNETAMGKRAADLRYNRAHIDPSQDIQKAWAARGSAKTRDLQDSIASGTGKINGRYLDRKEPITKIAIYSTRAHVGFDSEDRR